MAPPPLDQFARLVVQHRNLLIARVKITSYNQHRSAPFLRALVVLAQPSLLGVRSRQRHLISLLASRTESTAKDNACPPGGELCEAENLHRQERLCHKYGATTQR